jgi:hypothetical protein
VRATDVTMDIGSFKRMSFLVSTETRVGRKRGRGAVEKKDSRKKKKSLKFYVGHVARLG